MIVADRETVLRIVDKLLPALKGENIHEVNLALCTLYCASNAACGYPAIFAESGVRSTLEQPTTHEVLERLEEARR